MHFSEVIEECRLLLSEYARRYVNRSDALITALVAPCAGV